MKEPGIRKLIDYVGFFAVILSVLLLAYQVQRGNRIAEATATYEIIEKYNDFNLTMAGDESMTALFVGLSQRDFSPTEEQHVAAGFVAFAMLNLYGAIETAHRNGLIDEFQFSLARQDAASISDYFPSLMPYLADALNSHPAYRVYELVQALDVPASP